MGKFCRKWFELRKLVVTNSVLHLIAIICGSLIVAIAIIPQMPGMVSKLFQAAFVPELGTNLVRIDKRVTGKPEHVEMNFAVSTDSIFEFFFQAKKAKYISTHFDKSMLKVKKINDTASELFHSSKLLPGLYTIHVLRNQLWITDHSNKVILEKLPIQSNPDIFLRVGDRITSQGVTFPRNLKAIFYDLSGSKNAEYPAYSLFRYITLVLTGGFFLALVFVIFPSVVFGLFFPKRIKIVETLLIIILPFSPLFIFSFRITAPSFNDQVMNELEVIPETYQVQKNRCLIIGGSAAAGTPQKKQNAFHVDLESISQNRGCKIKALNLAQEGSDANEWLSVIDSVLKETSPQVVIVYLNFNTINFATANDFLPSIFEVNFALFNLVDSVPRHLFINPDKAPKVAHFLITLVDKIQSFGAQVIVIDDPVGDFYPFIKEYDQISRSLVKGLKNRQIPIVEAKDIFHKANEDFWFYDSCHLSPAGNRKLAELTWEKILQLGLPNCQDQ